MKRYELVKYKYGLKPYTSTACGIGERKKDGQFRVLRHFQTPEAARHTWVASEPRLLTLIGQNCPERALRECAKLRKSG